MQLAHQVTEDFACELVFVRKFVLLSFVFLVVSALCNGFSFPVKFLLVFVGLLLLLFGLFELFDVRNGIEFVFGQKLFH